MKQAKQKEKKTYRVWERSDYRRKCSDGISLARRRVRDPRRRKKERKKERKKHFREPTEKRILRVRNM